MVIDLRDLCRHFSSIGLLSREHRHGAVSATELRALPYDVMRLTVVTIIALSTLDCSGPPRAGAPVRPVTMPANLIAVGQQWGDATVVATHAGYQLQDAAQLQAIPPPDGFYLNLPNHQGLLVLRNKDAGTVATIERVEGWDGPRGLREYHEVTRFRLPPAEPAAK